MRPLDEIHQVRELVGQGLNDCEIFRRTGIPRRTVRDWRHNKRWRPEAARSHLYACPVCQRGGTDVRRLPAPDYAYLLGMYLGDGYLARFRRGVYQLRIKLDIRYPAIIDACAQAMAQVVPENSVSINPCVCKAVDVRAYSKHWPCLFPQHGPGLKHLREIKLADWQQRIVDVHTRHFIRGLIHSDGCRFINPIRHGDKVYRYSRYNFSNASADIRAIFCDACDRLGIEWRQMNAHNISIARRESVALMDQFIGPKR